MSYLDYNQVGRKYCLLIKQNYLCINADTNKGLNVVFPFGTDVLSRKWAYLAVFFFVFLLCIIPLIALLSPGLLNGLPLIFLFC